MKKSVFILFLVLGSLRQVQAKETILVADQKVVVEANSKQEIFLGFYKGDKMLLSFTELNQKALSKVELVSYPSGVVHKIKDQYSADKVRIKISNTGVYFIRLTNGAFGKREVQLKVERIASNVETSAYTSEVKWKEVEDTTTYLQRVIEEVYETSYQVQALYPRNSYFLNAKSFTNDNDNSKLLIPIQIPENTLTWFYRFSTANRSSEIRHAMDSCSLYEQLAGHVAQMDSFTKQSITLDIPVGKAYCDFLLLDQKNASDFLNNAQFDYYNSGSRVNSRSGIVNVENESRGNFYIGIRNPDEQKGVYFCIEVVAVVVEKSILSSRVNERGIRVKRVPFIEYRNE